MLAKEQLELDRRTWALRVVTSLQAESHLIASFCFLAFRDENPSKKELLSIEANEALKSSVLRSLLELEGVSEEKFLKLLQNYSEDDLAGRQLNH
mmetsp:Transcript_36739/g.27197  ORF Transcript_36739/g.27197 Transcript_36739/m.27197 type:complete len:95 (+) Transcript_36739:132-416(+)